MSAATPSRWPETAGEWEAAIRQMEQPSMGSWDHSLAKAFRAYAKAQTTMLADTLEFVDSTMQCACSPLERHSGHLTDCLVPVMRDRIETALRLAGRIP